MSSQAPQIEFITERALVAAEREQTLDVLLRITPPRMAASASARPHLNLCLVLDRSGSMAGEKMVRAREAAAYCVDQLLPTDRIALVLFDDRIDVLIESRPAAHKAELKSLIAEVQARGMTALHEAWVRGGMQVSEHLSERGVNRVLLLTDGLANVGKTNSDRIVSQAQGLAARGVSTSTIGIGADFNENLLVPLAQAAGGNAWHVEGPDDMQRIFAVELEGLVTQVAHSVTLGLVPSDGVRLVDVLNDFPLGETGRYRLPNLQAGAPLEVLVQLRVPAHGAGETRRLLDVKLGYTPQERTGAEVSRAALEVRFAPPSEVAALPVNHDVAKAVQLLMNARARREAMRHMDAGDFGAAQTVVGTARAATMVAAAAMPAAARPSLSTETDLLAQLESALADRSQDKMNRKRMAYQDYARRYGKEEK